MATLRTFKLPIRRISLLAFLALTGCLGGSSSDTFSGLLDNPDGGTGTASISITSYSPPTASVVLKSTDSSDQFLVSATGKGTLRYAWTLDGASVGGDSPTYTMVPTSLSVGSKTLKVVITDEAGTTSQTWSVKINGTPVIDSATPSPTSVYARRTNSQSYSISVSDPNSDTLTYVWKLDGQENVLTSTTNSTTWTPSSTDVGTHTVAVDIYDGPSSDTGTWKVTRTWTTYVNHFADACNQLENQSQTNKSCVLVGISGIGDGLDPVTSASSFYIRPSAFAKTSNDNLFIADDMNHVVWFYNKYSSPAVTMLGVTVPVNTMKIVAGVGMATSGNSASNLATRNFLNSPQGLYWDGTNLYISDTSNNRVWKVDNTGTRSYMFTAGCTSPRGITAYGGQMFVACYTNSIILQVDMTTLATSTFAGTGAAANPATTNESTFTDATDGKLNNPYGIVADSSGNLYVGEYSGCRVHMYNRSGSAVNLFGGWTINNNKQRIILGPAGAPSCSTTAGTPTSTARVNLPRHLYIDPATNLLLMGTDGDVFYGINFSSSTSTLLGVNVAAYTAQGILGSGTAGYLGEGGSPSTTRFNNPFDIILDSTSGDYYLADYSNVRLRRFKSSGNVTELVAGNGSQAHQTNAGQGLLEVGLEKMNAVRGLAYDTVSGEIFIADSGNNRIRVVNRYGQIQQAVGTGSSGTGAEEDEYPSNVTMSSERGMTLVGATASFGGHLVWADTGNHRIRIWNRSTSDQTLFGVVVSAGKVATIGGNGTVGNATSGSALQAAFSSPSGVATDGTNIFVADTSNHCIKKIDSSGALSGVSGTCGTSGNVDGAYGTGRMSSPEAIDYYNYNGHQGLVIAASGNARIKFYRLAGSNLLFGGSIAVGDTANVACGGSYHTESINASLATCGGTYGVTALSNGSFCFTNYSYHDVRCVDSSGLITTAMGAVQGIDNTTNLYFPGMPFNEATYDSAAAYPNYNSQNGVKAFYLPSPLTAEPGINESFGQLMFPITLKALDSKTLIIGNYNIGLITKMKLP